MGYRNRREKGRFALLIACALSLTLFSGAQAQGLSAEVSDRCVRATVRVEMDLENGSGTSSGSGSLIDPRGYVLTNFHVVGHHGPDTGPPGTLLNRRNRVRIGMVRDARSPSDAGWVGAVVRADVRLDLALIRIISDAQGNPVGERRFPTVPMSGTDSLRPGSRVWAFGFPLNVRTINVTEGSIAGFQMNGQRQVAWLRSDAEFNPGNSGGMLVDQRGHLIGVPTRVFHGRGRTLEPVELARPVERMPTEWTQALRSGHLDRFRIQGVQTLSPGSSFQAQATGDQGAVGTPDRHFYRVDAATRGGVIRTQPPLPIGVLARDRVVAEGRGNVRLPNLDPALLTVVVLIEASDATVPYAISLQSAPQGAVAAGPGPNTIPNARVANPPAGVRRAPVITPNPRLFRQGQGAAQHGAAAVGRVIDAPTGRPVFDASVLVGLPGTDLAAAIQAVLAGRLHEEQLARMLVAFATTNAAGQYQLQGLPPGNYPGLVLSQGHQLAPLQLHIQGGRLSLSDVVLQRVR